MACIKRRQVVGSDGSGQKVYRVGLAKGSQSGGDTAGNLQKELFKTTVALDASTPSDDLYGLFGVFNGDGWRQVVE